MTIKQSAAVRRGRLLLLAIVSVAALLSGIVAMHAQLATTDPPSDRVSSAMTPSPAIGTDSGAAVSAAMNVMHNGMGDMGGMDCLLLGMVCLFGVAALLLLVLAVKLRSQLRRRLAARAWAAALTVRLRSPEPPSLLVLSISRI